MSGHTPGPWEFSGNWVQTVDNKKFPIANFNFTAATDANARLIAAAPDLLEALERYVHAIAVGGGSDKDLIMDAIRQADNKARAAIAKAKGEA